MTHCMAEAKGLCGSPRDLLSKFYFEHCPLLGFVVAKATQRIRSSLWVSSATRYLGAGSAQSSSCGLPQRPLLLQPYTHMTGTTDQNMQTCRMKFNFGCTYRTILRKKMLCSFQCKIDPVEWSMTLTLSGSWSEYETYGTSADWTLT